MANKKRWMDSQADEMSSKAKKAANSLSGERGREIRNIVNEDNVVNLEPMDAVQNAANMQSRANEAMREWANTNPEAYKQFIQSQLPTSPADMVRGINGANSQVEMLPEAQWANRGTDYQPSLRGTNTVREGLFNNYNFADRAPIEGPTGDRINGYGNYNFLTANDNGEYPTSYRDMTGIRDQFAGAGNADPSRYNKPVAENFNNPRNLPRMPEVPKAPYQQWPDSAAFMYQDDLWRPKSPADMVGLNPNFEKVAMPENIKAGSIEEGYNWRPNRMLDQRIENQLAGIDTFDNFNEKVPMPEKVSAPRGGYPFTGEDMNGPRSYTSRPFFADYEPLGDDGLRSFSYDALQYGQGSEYPMTKEQAVAERNGQNHFRDVTNGEPAERGAEQAKHPLKYQKNMIDDYGKIDTAVDNMIDTDYPSQAYDEAKVDADIALQNAEANNAYRKTNRNARMKSGVLNRPSHLLNNENAESFNKQMKQGYEIPAPSQAELAKMVPEHGYQSMTFQKAPIDTSPRPIEIKPPMPEGKKVEYKDAAMESYPKAKGNNPKVQTGGMKYPEGKSANPFMIPAGVQAAANMVKGGNTTAGLVGAAGVLAAAGVNATMDTAMVVDGLLRMGADANRVAEFLASDEGKQYLAEQANDLAQRRLDNGID